MFYQALINYSHGGFFCAQYAQNKMYTREPGSQQGKSFRKEGSALHLAIAIQSQKGCYVNHQTGCPEMLWNPHHFKEEIQQVSGLRTGKKNRHQLVLKEFSFLCCCRGFSIFPLLFYLHTSSVTSPRETKIDSIKMKQVFLKLCLQSWCFYH